MTKKRSNITAEPLRVLSLGAGVDSTTLLLLSEHGEVPRLDAAIFADTMAEPPWVYETLEWLSDAVTIPIFRVSVGDLHNTLIDMAMGINKSKSHYYPPFYMRKYDGKAGAPLHRRCTKAYKIVPVKRKIRELLKCSTTRRHVEQWIGFSLDDIGRTFCSDVQWLTNVFPLILPLRMRRRDCIKWLEDHGYPVPQKSSCIFCPYHRNSYWRDMRDNRPDEWRRAVTFEESLHHGNLPGARGTPYVHSSMIPLSMAPIDIKDTGQEELFCMACNT